LIDYSVVGVDCSSSHSPDVVEGAAAARWSPHSTLNTNSGVMPHSYRQPTLGHASSVFLRFHNYVLRVEKKRNIFVKNVARRLTNQPD
jgi:hypothetical protein